jgi:hypothetical protein
LRPNFNSTDCYARGRRPMYCKVGNFPSGHLITTWRSGDAKGLLISPFSIFPPVPCAYQTNQTFSHTACNPAMPLIAQGTAEHAATRVLHNLCYLWGPKRSPKETPPPRASQQSIFLDAIVQAILDLTCLGGDRGVVSRMRC